MSFIELPPGLTNQQNAIQTYLHSFEGDNKFVYLIGGVHGDEIEGITLGLNLFSALKENLPSFSVIYIPILNVDGHLKHRRTNANGVDLNRNLPSKNWSAEAREEKYFPGLKPLSEIENIYLLSLFEKYPPKFILSFHSWYPVLNYNGKCKEIAEFLSRYNQYPIEADFEGHPTPGSLGEYGPQELNCPVLTFECPLLETGITHQEIWDKNREGFLKLFKSDLLK